MAASSSTSARTPMDLGIWQASLPKITSEISSLHSFIHERIQQVRDLPEIRSCRDLQIGLDATSSGFEIDVIKIEGVYRLSVSLPFLMKAEEMTQEFSNPMCALLRSTYSRLPLREQRHFNAFLLMCTSPENLEKSKKYILYHELSHIANGDCETLPKDDAESVAQEIRADKCAVFGSQERTEGGIHFNLAHAEAFKGCPPATTHPTCNERVRYLIAHLGSLSKRITVGQIKDYCAYLETRVSDWDFLLANCCALETLIITDAENSCGLLERIGTKTMGFNAHNLFSLMIRLPHLRSIELGSCSSFIDEDNLKEMQKRFPHIVIQSLPGFLKLDFGLKKISTVTIAMPTLPYLSLAEAFYTPLVTTSGAGGFPIFHQPI